MVTTHSRLRHLGIKENKNRTSTVPVDMRRVACAILGGGQGTRLHPLTQSRCKPAICFGGRYKLIDIPISNSVNSNIEKIFILTQFLSVSLHRHIVQTYKVDSGYIEFLSAEQRPDRTDWYQGTADAVRQNMDYLLETSCDYFLILSGDQLYHLNFQKMFQCALEKDVDVLVAALPVPANEAKRMGIMKVNEDNQIIDFYEKPDEQSTLDRLKTPPSVLEKMGLSATTNNCYLGSMGIYLFKREALIELLKSDLREDFGKHLIPSKVKLGNIAAFPHQGYWEDIGTIESFYNANIGLTKSTPQFNCYDEKNPIYTTCYHLPAPKISNANILNSIICEGSVVEASEVSNSILGQRSILKKGVRVIDSYVMGNDFYEKPAKSMINIPDKLHIDENSIIKKAVIDNNVHIGKNVQLVNKNNLDNYDGNGVYIRDGIIVVPRGSVIPDNFVI